MWTQEMDGPRATESEDWRAGALCWGHRILGGSQAQPDVQAGRTAAERGPLGPGLTHYCPQVYETPFYVAVDHDKKKVVISIRGTLSPKVCHSPLWPGGPHPILLLSSPAGPPPSSPHRMPLPT